MYLTASSDGTFGICGSDGNVRSLSKEEFEAFMNYGRPEITETVEELAAECLTLLDTLFKDKTAHPVLLDGREIEPVSGNAPGETYNHYVNGHVLETQGKRQSYTCYTYLDRVEMEEQMIVDDGIITAVLINTFAYSGIQTSAPDHASWQSNLLHMRDLLAASVARWVVECEPDAS